MGIHPQHVSGGTRSIDDIPLAIVELIWPGGHRSFQAYLPDGTDLTADSFFDTHPADGQLLHLLDEHRGWWRCPCGTPFTATDTDLICDHVRDCPAHLPCVDTPAVSSPADTQRHNTSAKEDTQC